MVTFTFQVRIIAYDTAYTDQVTTAVVPIQVTRNEYAPIFSRPEYRLSLAENHRLGSSVIQMSATDADKVEYMITCRIKKDVSKFGASQIATSVQFEKVRT